MRLGPAYLLLSPPVQPEIDEKPGKPGLESPGDIERRDALERPEKGVLDQIVGIIGVLHDAPGNDSCLREIALHQAIERLGVAGLDPGEELPLIERLDWISPGGRHRRPCALRGSVPR